MTKLLLLFSIFFPSASFAGTVTFSITVTDGKEAEVLDAFVKAHGYQAVLPSGANNPESVNDATQRLVAAFIRDGYQTYTVKAAIDPARTTAISNARAVEIQTPAPRSLK